MTVRGHALRSRGPARVQWFACAHAARHVARPAVAMSLALAALALSGCATIKEYMPTIPAPITIKSYIIVIALNGQDFSLQ